MYNSNTRLEKEKIKFRINSELRTGCIYIYKRIVLPLTVVWLSKHCLCRQ